MRIVLAAILLSCPIALSQDATPTAEEQKAIDAIVKAGGKASIDPKLAAEARVAAKFEALTDKDLIAVAQPQGDRRDRRLRRRQVHREGVCRAQVAAAPSQVRPRQVRSHSVAGASNRPVQGTAVPRSRGRRADQRRTRRAQEPHAARTPLAVGEPQDHRQRHANGQGLRASARDSTSRTLRSPTRDSRSSRASTAFARSTSPTRKSPPTRADKFVDEMPNLRGIRR